MNTIEQLASRVGYGAFARKEDLVGNATTVHPLATAHWPATGHPPTTIQPPAKIRYTNTRSVRVSPQLLERHRVATVRQGHVDEFRLLRTQILMKMRDNGWQTLAVTSPNKGAGKTTLCVNLAIGFGVELDHTSLLVDADLRDPDVRGVLGLPSGPGLVDYLMGNATLPSTLIHPDLGNLVVLSGGTPVKHASELMRSPMMSEMIRELRGRYQDRIIVFDLPPVLAGADTLAISEFMEATILVVEERKTSREQIRESCELLRHSNLIGVVLNKSRDVRDLEPTTKPKPGLIQRLLGTQA